MTPTAEVPVTAVVLYSSGVGYFEHTGQVTGTATTELRFKTAQINDILKSLVLQDTGGGKIGTIIYPSHDPISKTLKSFQVDLTENPSLAALLNQLRGAAVAVSLSTDKITGTILGLEKRPKAVERTHIEVWVLNLLIDGTIRSIPLDDIGTLTLQDPQLQQELTRALAIVSQARDQDKKPVTIQFIGEGPRAVRIGYVVEAPLWKSSYRLILPKEGSADPAHLQGWAIIENQTDNDWPAITLTLVSGRPISFIQELYQPTYLPRPTVQPELYTSLRPPVYGAGVGRIMEETRSAGPAAASASAPGTVAMAKRRGRNFQGVARESAVMDHLIEDQLSLDPSSSVASAADAAQLGELFQYTVTNISLPRQRSAMIPIVTDPITVERLSIYNESVLARHPLYGLKLTNTTGKHLLQGPVTVLEASAYAGDARIDNLPPDQHRFLSYGIDLHILINTTRRESRAKIQTATIAKGILELSEKLVYRTEYVAENKSDKPKVLLIEHPVQAPYTLVDTPAPIETTDTHYRLRYDLPAKSTQTFTVQTQWLRSRSLALIKELAATLQIFSQSANVPPRVAAAIEDAMRRRRAVNDLEQQITAIETQLAELTKEQGRIRENLKTAPSGSPYHNRLLGKLNEQETLFEKLQSDLDSLRQRRDKANQELADHLSTLNLTD